MSKTAFILSTSFLCPWDRFWALGSGSQDTLSDQERCGAILSHVLGAESPVYHLGATQVSVGAGEHRAVLLSDGQTGWGWLAGYPPAP